MHQYHREASMGAGQAESMIAQTWATHRLTDRLFRGSYSGGA
jgi:hypothetical protein